MDLGKAVNSEDEHTPQALSERRDRRGVGLRGPLPDADDRRRPAAAARPARGLQRPALVGAHRLACGATCPNDLPPWEAVYQQTQRWLAAGCFEAIADDLRALLRVAAGRDAASRRRSFWTVARCNRPRRAGTGPASTGTRAEGLQAPRRRRHARPSAGARVHAGQRAGAGAGRGAGRGVQAVTGNTVELAFVDQGYTGEDPAEAAEAHGIELEVVSLPEAKTGLRAAAPALGGRALVRLGEPVPPPG